MKGIIELISPDGGMIGVRTETSCFSVMELLGGYAPESGDMIVGNLESLGGEEIKNQTQNEIWDVCIENICESKQSAAKMISKN